MAHSVCPDDQAQRGEKGLYGTLCVSGRPSAALGGRTIWHTLCVFRTPCDQRTAAGPQQGHAFDASRKLARRAAFSAVSFCNGVVGCCHSRFRPVNPSPLCAGPACQAVKKAVRSLTAFRRLVDPAGLEPATK